MNSSVVYNEIISIARTSLNKSCLSSFCTVTNFALAGLGFATKTAIGTAATFSITLVSNFVKRKAFRKRFFHNDNNNTGNMFRGLIPH
jgi:hypothetical protein